MTFSRGVGAVLFWWLRLRCQVSMGRLCLSVPGTGGQEYCCPFTKGNKGYPPSLEALSEYLSKDHTSDVPSAISGLSSLKDLHDFPGFLNPQGTSTTFVSGRSHTLFSFWLPHLSSDVGLISRIPSSWFMQEEGGIPRRSQENPSSLDKKA
jgi:hypothetical protein